MSPPVPSVDNDAAVRPSHAAADTTLGRLAVTMAGRAGAAVLARLGVAISRSTVLRVLMGLPLPQAPTPRVLCVDDVALRRGLATRRC
jgi:hypothetical protein